MLIAEKWCSPQVRSAWGVYSTPSLVKRLRNAVYRRSPAAFAAPVSYKLHRAAGRRPAVCDREKELLPTTRNGSAGAIIGAADRQWPHCSERDGRGSPISPLSGGNGRSAYLSKSSGEGMSVTLEADAFEVADKVVLPEGLSSAPVRTVIIDDHDVVHAGVRAWCAGAEPEILFVGDFAHPDEFLTRNRTASEPVDVVVLDLQTGGSRPAFHTLQQLCGSGYRVVVFSHVGTDEVILRCLELGVVSYVLKSEGRAHLIEAIRTAGSAKPYTGPSMARALLNDNIAGRPNLSEREKQVLVAWFQTESKELVGKRLFIAPSTVRTHLQRARAKYAAVGRPAPTKSALLARAVEDGILGLSDV